MLKKKSHTSKIETKPIQDKPPEEKQQDPRTAQLKEYIINSLNTGYPKETLYTYLTQQGWPQETLNGVFQEIEQKTAQTPQNAELKP